MATLDMRGANRLEKSIAFLNDNALRLGWISDPLPSEENKVRADDKMKNDKGISTPTTVAQVARAHELGRGVPQRSMLKETMMRRGAAIGKAQGAAVAQVLAGSLTPKQGMSLVGEFVIGQVKLRMRKGIPPDLSDARKAQKKRAGRSKDTPLINFGQLINSVRYKIVPAE